MTFVQTLQLIFKYNLQIKLSKRIHVSTSRMLKWANAYNMPNETDQAKYLLVMNILINQNRLNENK